VAIASGGKVKALVEDGSDRYTHAEKLNSFIHSAIEKAGMDFSDLDAVAVSKGPGSYTGLRIGVSAAKGLCYGLGIKLIALNTLEAMAGGIDEDDNTLLIPMIDARRMEVFCAGYLGDGTAVFETRAEIVGSDSFPDAEAFKKVIFFGDGAEKCRSLLESRGFVYRHGLVAGAGAMARLAQKNFEEGRFESVAYFEPFYLKDFIAGKKKKPAK